MIVIGDVHGCYQTLLALVEQLPSDERLCFVGDLIDRGPSSREVVEFVRSHGHHCVLGNHEEMLCHSSMYDMWLQNGGRATLRSYEGHESAFEDDRRWMCALPTALLFTEETNHEGRSLLVTHAGIVESIAYSSQTRLITWNRGNATDLLDKFNVFGHTPLTKPAITHFYANIDTSCVYGRTLTALQFPQMKLYSQPCIDDV